MYGELNTTMEFDHVIEVHADGSITDRNDIYAPELRNEELSPRDGWELLNGYSGQDSYSGPIMHNSEYIGGQMERDILETPGVYVTLVSYYPGEDDYWGDEAEGWAVARMINPPLRPCSNCGG